MGRFKRKHKTLPEAKKALAKANEDVCGGYNIYKLRNSKVWKFLVATDIEWLNELY